MSSEVEPSISALVQQYEAAAAAVAPDWRAFRKCPTCRAASGEPCHTAEGPRHTVLLYAHAFRKRRSGR